MSVIRVCTLVLLLIPQILMAESVTTYVTLQTKNNDGLSIDSLGNLYVSHLGNLNQGSVYNGVSLFKVEPGGFVTTLSAQLKGPTANAVDSNNSVYVREKNSGIIWVFSEANGQQSFALLQGDAGSNSVLNGNNSLYIDEFDQVYIGSSSQGKIFRISNDGILEEYAASGLFSQISSITGDEIGNLFVGLWNSQNILKVDTNQQVSRFSSLPTNSSSLYVPYITYVDGMLYATNSGDNKIYSINQNGTVQHFAGTGDSASIDGTKLNASFFQPTGIVASTDGNTLYVSEFGSNKIRAIDIYFEDPIAPLSSVANDSAENSGGGAVELILLFSMGLLFLVQLIRKKRCSD